MSITTSRDVLDTLSKYDFDKNIYVQVGYNRFKIEEIIKHSDGNILITIEDAADNPVIAEPEYEPEPLKFA